jgi:hypothetical protein
MAGNTAMAKYIYQVRISVLEWILVGIAIAGGAVFVGYLKLRSIDSEIRRGVERARMRDFHETGGRWSRLPWEKEKD